MVSEPERPALNDEVEITPAMIKAGADVLRDLQFSLTDGDITPAEVAQAVWLAMLKSVC